MYFTHCTCAMSMTQFAWKKLVLAGHQLMSQLTDALPFITPIKSHCKNVQPSFIQFVSSALFLCSLGDFYLHSIIRGVFAMLLVSCHCEICAVMVYCYSTVPVGVQPRFQAKLICCLYFHHLVKPIICMVLDRLLYEIALWPPVCSVCAQESELEWEDPSTHERNKWTGGFFGGLHQGLARWEQGRRQGKTRPDGATMKLLLLNKVLPLLCVFICLCVCF